MKRTNLSTEQMDNIIRLRQTGSSWLGIEKLTGIPRRVAQRAYGKWERARSTRELETARWEVSKAEFERHLDALTWLAEGLITSLKVPELPNITEDAGTYLSTFWERDIPDSLVSGSSRTVNKNDRARIIRRNELLFESLKEHTEDKINWAIMGEWADSWDECYRLMPDLELVAGKTIQDTVSTIPGFEDGLISPRKLSSSLDRLTGAAMEVLWRGILDGDPTAATGLLEAKRIMHQGREITLVTVDEKPLLQLDQAKLDRDPIVICREAIANIWSTDVFRSMETEVRQMQKLVMELETGLEPLVLRPMILRTRCKICPV